MLGNSSFYTLLLCLAHEFRALPRPVRFTEDTVMRPWTLLVFAVISIVCLGFAGSASAGALVAQAGGPAVSGDGKPDDWGAPRFSPAGRPEDWGSPLLSISGKPEDWDFAYSPYGGPVDWESVYKPAGNPEDWGSPSLSFLSILGKPEDWEGPFHRFARSIATFLHFH